MSSMLPRSAKRLQMNGLYPATVTPFAEDLSVDYDALSSHLQDTFDVPGVNGVVVNSGLGELLQLKPDEQAEMIRLALKLRHPGQLVISGIEGHNPSLVVEAGLAAKAAGAEALLVFPPFDKRAYRRLAGDPASVRAFFARMDAEVGLPMIVFQYPPNSGCAYSIAALQAIADIPNVVAIKAATAGDMPAYTSLWDALHDKVSILVGVDSSPLLDMLHYGAHGALIGISGIATDRWALLLQLVAEGKRAEAKALFDKVCVPLMISVFENQQPKKLTSDAAATKEALFQLGCIPSARVRPPAIVPDAETRAEIRQSLLVSGLLETARHAAE